MDDDKKIRGGAPAGAIRPLIPLNRYQAQSFESELKKIFQRSGSENSSNDKNEVEKLIDRAIPGSEDKHEK